MTKTNKLNARISALADYLGIEFVDRGNDCMCVKTDDKSSLSSEDIYRIIDTLIHSSKFKEDYDGMWKRLESILKLRIEMELNWSAEDQAKFYAINEILKANYREKLNKVEEE